MRRGRWGGGGGAGVADCVVLMTSAAGSRPLLSGDRAIIRHPPHSNLPPPSPSQKQMHSSVVFVCWNIAENLYRLHPYRALSHWHEVSVYELKSTYIKVKKTEHFLSLTLMSMMTMMMVVMLFKNKSYKNIMSRNQPIHCIKEIKSQ